MVVIGRPINGICLNGIEYLEDEKNNIIQFNNEQEAKLFMLENGFSPNIVNSFLYENVTKEINCGDETNWDNLERSGGDKL